jgi:hypothetical protein
MRLPFWSKIGPGICKYVESVSSRLQLPIRRSHRPLFYPERFLVPVLVATIVQAFLMTVYGLVLQK